VTPIADRIGWPVLGGQIGMLWNPWRAGAAFGLGAIVLGAAGCYLPRYINGDL